MNEELLLCAQLAATSFSGHFTFKIPCSVLMIRFRSASPLFFATDRNRESKFNRHCELRPFPIVTGANCQVVKVADLRRAGE
jgi:hypothetical protein